MFPELTNAGPILKGLSKHDELLQPGANLEKPEYCRVLLSLADEELLSMAQQCQQESLWV